MSSATSPSDAIFLLYDNTSPSFVYSGFAQADIDQSYLPREFDTIPLYNDTLFVRSATEDGGGQIEFQFEGDAVRLYGEYRGTGITWNIDQGQPHNLTTDSGPLDEFSTTWGQILTLTSFENDRDKVLYLDFGPEADMVLDFAVVAGGYSQEYSETTSVIVDDDTPSEIFYFGDWDKRVVGRESLTQQVYLPFQNATHRTSTVGSGFVFRFLGTSISVYGCRKIDRPGSHDITFTLDGELQAPRNFTITGEDTIFNEGQTFTEFPHLLIAEFKALEPKEHTLMANLTSINGLGGGFIFDYLVYTPAFRDRAARPQFNISELNPNLRTVEATANTSKSDQVPIIIAGTIAGVLFLLLIVSVTFALFWRREARRYHQVLPGPDKNISSATAAPLQLTASASEVHPYELPFGLTIQAQPHQKAFGNGSSPIVPPERWLPAPHSALIMKTTDVIIISYRSNIETSTIARRIICVISINPSEQNNIPHEESRESTAAMVYLDQDLLILHRNDDNKFGALNKHYTLKDVQYGLHGERHIVGCLLYRGNCRNKIIATSLLTLGSIPVVTFIALLVIMDCKGDVAPSFSSLVEGLKLTLAVSDIVFEAFAAACAAFQARKAFQEPQSRENKFNQVSI
ncbi:hypothetical protein FA15DRAFT_698607, partial [Coprinopsis marcescibilis]